MIRSERRLYVFGWCNRSLARWSVSPTRVRAACGWLANGQLSGLPLSLCAQPETARSASTHSHGGTTLTFELIQNSIDPR